MKKLFCILAFLFLWVSLPLTPSSVQAQTLPDQLNPLFDIIDSIITGLGLPSTTETDLMSLSSDIRNRAVSGNCPFFVVRRMLEGLYCKMVYAVAYTFGVPVVEAIPLVDIWDIDFSIVSILFKEFTFDPFNVDPPDLTPRPQPPAPPSQCEVKIQVDTRDGSLTTPGRTIFLGVEDIRGLQAMGTPAGGSYSWVLDPSDPAVAALSTFTNGTTGAGLNRAGFGAKKAGTYKVTVTYTDPNGKKCQATQFLIVR